MVVRSWSELDFDNVCSNAKVFGFDLDNTLASSKQPMKPAMIERFCALLDHTVVALISGGGMAVVTSQVLDVLTPNARRGNLHVMPTSGSRYYRWDGTQWALVYAHDLSEATVAADRLAALASVKEGMYGVEVKLADKARALEMLGKYLGLFDGTNPEGDTQKNNLFEAIAGAAEGGIDLNEIPEIQSSADVDADVVEET